MMPNYIPDNRLEIPEEGFKIPIHDMAGSLAAHYYKRLEKEERIKVEVRDRYIHITPTHKDNDKHAPAGLEESVI